LLLEDDHRIALAALAEDIAALAKVEISEPLQAAAARVLLIHRWRRIVLRFPEIPWELMPSDAPLANPRHCVAQAYWQLSEPGEAWMCRDTTASVTSTQASGRFKPV
jgi:phenylacetic acid degradation operon negative regulatory protein